MLIQQCHWQHRHKPTARGGRSSMHRCGAVAYVRQSLEARTPRGNIRSVDIITYLSVLGAPRASWPSTIPLLWRRSSQLSQRDPGISCDQLRNYIMPPQRPPVMPNAAVQQPGCLAAWVGNTAMRCNPRQNRQDVPFENISYTGVACAVYKASTPMTCWLTSH